MDSLRALAHPLRLQLLSLLTAGPLSATEVVHELELTHANASYHLRQLESAGYVEVVEERVKNGGRERVYGVTENHPQSVDKSSRDAYFRVLAAELVRRSDTLHRRDRTMTADADLWVLPEVWTQVVDQTQEAMQALHSKALRPRTPGAVRVSATVALFGMEG